MTAEDWVTQESVTFASDSRCQCMTCDIQSTVSRRRRRRRVCTGAD